MSDITHKFVEEKADASLQTKILDRFMHSVYDLGEKYGVAVSGIGVLVRHESPGRHENQANACLFSRTPSGTQIETRHVLLAISGLIELAFRMSGQNPELEEFLLQRIKEQMEGLSIKPD